MPVFRRYRGGAYEIVEARDIKKGDQFQVIEPDGRARFGGKLAVAAADADDSWAPGVFKVRLEDTKLDPPPSI